MSAALMGLLGLYKARSVCRSNVHADAERLIARYDDQAYFEARQRVKGRCIDGAQSSRHWTRVKLEVARLQGFAVGLAGADHRR
jgi:hypothetical protein